MDRKPERTQREPRITSEDTPRSTADFAACSDVELLRRIRTDDLAAFEAFFERYRNLIFRTAFGLTGERQVAEEILQDTFAQAYRFRASFRPDVSPLPWLHRVALNFCYSQLARRRLKTEPINELNVANLRETSSEPAERAEQRELRQIVREGIAELSPHHRSVIVLYYLHGMSLERTASILDVRLGTVKSRLHYALRNLRTHLERDRRFEPYGRPVPDEIKVESA
jgi:RNA polymerase sigma-70 factor (ECF subfamily)